MLDLNLLRPEKGGNPDLLRESQKKRFCDVSTVDNLIALEQLRRNADSDVSTLSGDYNSLNKQIASLKKEKKDQEAKVLMEQAVQMKKKIEDLNIQLVKHEKDLLAAMNQIGNLVHPTVPVSDNENDNRVEREWNKDLRRFNPDKKLYHHHELLWMIDGYEPGRGSNVAGHRGYFLKGAAVALNQALISYGMSFLSKRGYTSIQTPFFMKKDVMAETAQLSQFDEELYKVVGGDEDFYLIATSEQPISALHRGESITPSELPKRYAGISTCFRKEAGAHGRDAWGIFRVHQFEKIEQFVITSPEESWDELEKMIGAAEEFYQSLEIPYRVITIVSKELNNAAAKKYDLEAFFPTLETYRELVSCSNCTDYQSRNLGIRFGNLKNESGKSQFVHMLNATLCATERSMCCLLENYQTETGIRIPTVLQPFMNGMTFIPFTHEKPEQKGTTGVKVQGKPIKDVQKFIFHGFAATGETSIASNNNTNSNNNNSNNNNNIKSETSFADVLTAVKETDIANKLTALNDHLANKSYIGGHQPSTADLKVIELIASAPHILVARHRHVDRWFRHILSFDDNERKKLFSHEPSSNVLNSLFAPAATHNNKATPATPATTPATPATTPAPTATPVNNIVPGKLGRDNAIDLFE